MGFHIGAGLILLQEGKYVLVEESRSFKTGLYNMPAGTLEISEDIRTCVKREAEEETGATVEVEHFIGFYQSILGDGNNVLFFVFSGTVSKDAVFHSEEHHVIKAVTYDELVTYDRENKLRSPVVLKCIQDFRGGQKLPLSIIQSLRFDKLNAIAVEGGH